MKGILLSKAMLCMILILICCLPADYVIQAQGEKKDILEGQLFIPSLNLHAPVVFIPLNDGYYDLETLTYRVGHPEGTTWVDDSWGNVVLLGHSPGKFEDLKNIEIGAEVFIFSKVSAYYEITEIYTVPIDRTNELAPTKEPSITLITCTKDDNIRLIVKGQKRKFIYD